MYIVLLALDMHNKPFLCINKIFKYILICDCGYKMKMALDAFWNGLAILILNVLIICLKCYLLQGVLTLICCMTGIWLSNKHHCKTFYIKKLNRRLIRILNKTQVFCFSSIACSTVVLPLKTIHALVEKKTWVGLREVNVFF